MYRQVIIHIRYKSYKSQARNYTRFPRSSCSRSSASNNDLKFPAPNPEKLCRWIISMKTVGRSIKCYTPLAYQLSPFKVLGSYLRKQLQQIPTLIKINQNIQITNSLEILLQNKTGLLKSYLHILVVCVWNLDELDSPRFEIRDVADDIVC